MCCNFFFTEIRAQNIPQLRRWDITRFGGTSDGKKINTLSIQKTIDACFQAGGGTVIIPAGVFISGTIFLKSGVCIYLEENAVLKASENQQDYEIIPGLNYKGEPMFGKSGSFLIYAEKAKNISIQGTGKIDGSGAAFWHDEMLTEYVKKPKQWRPWALICFVNCKNIDVSQVTLTNSPCYTLWNLGCKDVKIDGINIQNPTNGPNTDGIDIDCCRNVVVQNCHIEGGDDAIAIKSDGGRLGKNRACQNIRITKCTLSSSPACAVRVGYEGDSPIKEVYCDNLTIKNSHHGINVVSIVADREAFPMQKGTRIKNVEFHDIQMQNVLQPIYIWMGSDRKNVKPLSYIKNIRIFHLTAENSGDSFIGSTLGRSIEGVCLENIHVKVKNSFNEGTSFYHNVWGSKNPYVFYFTNNKNLNIHNLNISFTDTGYWKSAVFFENSTKIAFHNFSITEQGKANLIVPIKTLNSFFNISK